MSEQTLDHLIAKLKSEAIEKAGQEADKITAKAREQADKIVEDARAKKRQMLADAESEATAILQKGKGALQQASRDIRIKVQNDLMLLLGKVLKHEVKGAFSTDLLKSTIIEVVTNVGKPTKIVLPEAVKKEVGAYILDRLQEANDEIMVAGDDQLLQGFTVTRTDQGWTYEITPEEVSEMLYRQLTPTWTNLLTQNSQK